MSKLLYCEPREVNTGVVLNEYFERVGNQKLTVFSVFNTVNEALDYANSRLGAGKGGV